MTDEQIAELQAALNRVAACPRYAGKIIVLPPGRKDRHD